MALSENQGRVRASFPRKTGIVALMQKGKAKTDTANRTAAGELTG